MYNSNSYVTIDLDAILHNFRLLKEKAGKKILAVVKADAYGHGAVAISKLLETECDWFGVSSAAEALELRKAGIQKSILILGHINPAAFPAIVAADIRPTIFSLEDGQALSQEALRQGKTAKFHFAVDTGMRRIGVQVTQGDADLCLQIAKLPGLQAEGVFSHFATADEEDLSATRQQAAAFEQFCQMLEARGLTGLIRHLDNTAGILNFGCHCDMVRAGISLYGLAPSDQLSDVLPFKPAMQWYAQVSHVKTVAAGAPVSYGGHYVTTKPTRIATVSAGYADGYRRSLSGNFYVLIRGEKAPILGRICMDQFMVDVTHIPQVTPGDRVVLMGTEGNETISAEALGSAADSFHYEQICDISRRVARVYLQDGKQVATVNYLLTSF